MVHRQEPVSARRQGLGQHKGPVRTCVGCRSRAMASELLRVVAVDRTAGEKTLVLDTGRRMAGRGAWIHPDLACLDTAERRRAFPRALRVPGPLSVEGLRVQVAHVSAGAGSSRAVPERRKQVDPS